MRKEPLFPPHQYSLVIYFKDEDGKVSKYRNIVEKVSIATCMEYVFEHIEKIPDFSHFFIRDLGGDLKGKLDIN